jgi:hypothetical protein
MWTEERYMMRGSWRKLHNEEIYNLHFSPSIIIMINLRRMKLAGHVARMGEERNAEDIDGKARRKETTKKTKI